MSETVTSRLLKNLPFIIFCGCMISMLSFGPRNVVGLFLTPMTELRGWDREVFALAIAIQNLVWGASQPFVGMIADKYGVARVLAGGAVLYAVGLVGMAYAETALTLHLFAGVIFGLGMSAASFTLVMAAFGRKVSAEKRSIAFGIATSAGSFGQLLFSFLGQGVIASAGWQAALIVMAGLVLLIVPLSIALQGRSESGPGALADDQALGAALAEAFGHRSFILLVSGFFVCGFHVAFVATHLPAFLVDNDIDASWGAAALAIIGLFNIVGALGAGYIGARFSKVYLLSFIYLARAALFAAFVLLPVTPVSVVVFSAILGLLWLSTVPTTSALVALMFGPRYMATLFGIVFFSHQVGAFIGVWLGGRLYDTTGSYDVVWWLGVALSIFAAIIHWPIEERPVARLESAG